MLQLGRDCVSVGPAPCDGLPGFALFLLEQTMFMKWEQVSFFVDETINFHCGVVRWTLRYGSGLGALLSINRRCRTARNDTGQITLNRTGA